MRNVLEFIKVFQSPCNQVLFTQCACYWFSVILSERFPGSSIVYNPESIHFATFIDNEVYDITGVVEDTSDYVYWDAYKKYALDAEDIIRDCIYLKGGE